MKKSLSYDKKRHVWICNICGKEVSHRHYHRSEKMKKCRSWTHDLQGKRIVCTYYVDHKSAHWNVESGLGWV